MCYVLSVFWGVQRSPIMGIYTSYAVPAPSNKKTLTQTLLRKGIFLLAKPNFIGWLLFWKQSPVGKRRQHASPPPLHS